MFGSMPPSPTPAASETGGTPAPDVAARWARTKAIFLAALEREAADRAAFVCEACGEDDALREEVESLLASDRAAASFGDTPAAALLASSRGAAETARLAAGMRLGNYRIEAFIAAGGMGEVYRARHLVLGREVAVKTVGGRSDEAARRRLLREARHAATLAHPNVCTIHEVGEEGGVPFIVMELVPGRSLAEVVAEGAPPLERALDIAVQVADALDYAHRQGILHRDLKASNVMVDVRGRAVVLDFGLAKRLPDADDATRDSTVTALGQLVGTLTHMAPEVLQGGRADARSDVWSLGVLLFELFSGELPFSGRTPFETSSAILADPPRRMPRRVPLPLRLVVERCLVKDPAGRYQHASEVRDAVDAVRRRRAWPLVGRLLVAARWRAIATAGIGVVLLVAGVLAAPALRARFGNPLAGHVSTLAFLPLEQAAGDSAEYYASGVTDALVAQLGVLANVRIISPTSTARALRGATSPADAARRLRADGLVMGRLRKLGDRIVVDMRIVEPRRGRVVWSDRFERGVREALVLQSDIVRALAAEVRLTVNPTARDRMAAPRAVNAEAYEAYLRGRFEWNKRTRESLQTAVRHFQRAVDLDPTYAPAHAALADCYNQFGTVMVGTGSPKEYRPRAEAEAIKALQIDPHSAEAHATLGYVRHYDWRWDEAERELRRAIELDPNYSLARVWYANLLMSRRRWNEAVAQVNLARELDPYSLVVNTNVAWILTHAGRFDEAIAQLHRTLAIDSTYWHAHWRLAIALMAARRPAEAVLQARKLVRLAGDSPAAIGLLAEAEARSGDTASARARVRGLEARAARDYVPPFSISGVYAALCDRERELRYFRLAIEERANGLAYTRVDERRARQDPEYRALVARIGLP